MGLIDTHTHLESFARKGALAATLERARQAGVEAMITIGTAPDDWTLYREIASAQPGFVHYAVGLHPCSVDGDWEKAVAQIEGFWREGAGTTASRAAGSGEPASAVAPGGTGATAVRPVALGECGLDRFHLPKDAAEAERIFGWQREAFRAQLAIARRLDCPVVVHSRGAFAESVELIDASGVAWERVVFHCFSEGPAEMAELARRGGVGSFTGILTYKSAGNIRAAAETQGLDRFMVETDAPYLTPVPHRGEPNEPAYVRHTAEYGASDVFRVPFDELAARSTANAKRFYWL